MQKLRQSYRPWKDGEKIEAAFFFQAGTVWASMETVYKSCIEDMRFNLRLILMEETTVETSHMTGAREFLEKKGLEYVRFDEADLEQNYPHVVFIQFPYDAAFHTPQTLSVQFRNRGARVVYIPYGLEISDTEIARKDHFQNYVIENSWRIYTCCEGIRREYWKYCRNRHAVRVCGSPKFDGVFRKEQFPLDEGIVKAAKGRRIVVWKLHFPKKIMEHGNIRQITPELEEYLNFARQIAQYRDFFFVLLAHPKMLGKVVESDIQGDESLTEKTRELIAALEEQEHVWIDRTEDYRNSLYHGDAIMMDRSGVIAEAAMTGAPVLFMKNGEYSERMTSPVQNVADSLYAGKSCLDMKKFMEQLRAGKDEKKELRARAVAENFPFLDGLCGERIKENIAEGLRERRKEKLDVILYGTGEICRYYMEQQRWGEQKKFRIIKIADTSEEKWESDFYGYKIAPPEEILEADFDAIVIMTEPHYFEIKKKLVYEMYLDERKIWRLDEFIWELSQS